MNIIFDDTFLFHEPEARRILAKEAVSSVKNPTKKSNFLAGLKQQVTYGKYLGWTRGDKPVRLSGLAPRLDPVQAHCCYANCP